MTCQEANLIIQTRGNEVLNRGRYRGNEEEKDSGFKTYVQAELASSGDRSDVDGKEEKGV